MTALASVVCGLTNFLRPASAFVAISPVFVARAVPKAAAWSKNSSPGLPEFIKLLYDALAVDAAKVKASWLD